MRDEETKTGSWWVAYAGFATALAGLFLALYATQINKEPEPGPAEIVERQVKVEVEVDRAQGEGQSRWASDHIRSSLAHSYGDENAVSLEEEEDSVVVRLAVQRIYERNQVAVAEDYRPLLLKLGQSLEKLKFRVRVEGHVDSSEENPSGQSAWELSVARAKWVIDFWVKKTGLSAERFGIAGYSFYRPLKTEDEENVWQTGVNRRVEVVVLTNQPIR